MNSLCPHARAPRLRAGAVVAFASCVLSCAGPVQGAGGPIPCAPATLAATDGVWALLDTSDFPPRWHCGNWTTLHGVVHIAADLAIWGAYTSIPLALVYFVRRRRDTPFPRLYWLFALFILSCGTGHLVEAGIFWWPASRLSAAVKVITAVVSWATVIALLPILPRALTIPRACSAVRARSSWDSRSSCSSPNRCAPGTWSSASGTRNTPSRGRWGAAATCTRVTGTAARFRWRWG